MLDPIRSTLDSAVRAAKLVEAARIDALFTAADLLGFDAQGRPSSEATIERRLPTNCRAGLVRDRTRSIKRLRSTLTGLFPALERVLIQVLT